jgi:glutathione synthase/RimK-type ligase-like ATP-grasp enzyme
MGEKIQGSMKLGIHNTNDSFSQRWVAYCDSHQIPYKIVNCYSNDIIDQLADCDGLFWHHQQGSAKDILFAKQLLFSLQQSGKKVFPDFNTAWHFDDKVGQKYLLESLAGDHFIPTWVFYSKAEAHTWAAQTTFPKVFKLRSGAGSQNVRLVNTQSAAMSIIAQAFNGGFKPYDAVGSLKERVRKYKLGKVGVKEIVKGLVRLVVAPRYANVKGKESGYVYFQEFIPENDSDIRVIVIGDKAFGIKRMVRKNDFRASGSGWIIYDRNQVDLRCVSLAFEITSKLQAQCLAYDFVFDHTKKPLLIEISYGFAPAGYEACTGYWDRQLRWHEGPFNPYEWMILLVLNGVKSEPSLL